MNLETALLVEDFNVEDQSIIPLKAPVGSLVEIVSKVDSMSEIPSVIIPVMVISSFELLYG